MASFPYFPSSPSPPFPWEGKLGGDMERRERAQAYRQVVAEITLF